MRIFVISLVRSLNRRESVSKLFSKCQVDFEFIDAQDGKLLEPNIVKEISERAPVLTRNFVNKLLASEVGCAFSHLSVYKKIVTENIPYAIILEDDVLFDHQFKQLVKLIDDKLQPFKKFEFVLLGYSPDNKNFREKACCSIWHRDKIGIYKFGKPINWYWGAYAYYITLSGAQKLLNASEPVRMPADILTTNCPNYSVYMGVISNPIVWPGPENSDSTIGERLQEKNVILQHSSKNKIAWLINCNPLSRNLKVFIYLSRAFILQKKVYLRILLRNPWKHYIKKF